MDDARRDISFSWGANDDATAYELEFSQAAAGGGSTVVGGGPKSVKGASWRGQLAPGRYQVRLRSLDQRGVPGPWGKAFPLKVPFGAVETTAPRDGANIKLAKDAGPGAVATTQAAINLRWQGQSGAAGYQVVVESGGKTLYKKQVPATELNLQLPVARTYSWRVRAVSSDGDEGDQGDEQKFTLLGAALAQPRPVFRAAEGHATLSWAKVPNAATYSVKLEQRDANGRWTSADEPMVQKDSVFSLDDTDAGVYRIQVVAQAAARPNSVPGEVMITLEDPKLTGAMARRWRLNAAYTPRYWVHDAAADDASGVTFDLLIFEAFKLDAEYWFRRHTLSVEATYAHWSTVLFGKQLPGDGVAETQPAVPIRGQDIAVRGKVLLPLPRDLGSLSLLAGLRRSSVFFFYKSDPSTIAAFTSQATNLTGGAGLDLWLGSGNELRGWAEINEPLSGQGFTVKRAQDYRLSASFAHPLIAGRLALLLVYQYDYEHWQYVLNSLNLSGHVTDTTHSIGAGLELSF